jgi:hypothetical protein
VTPIIATVFLVAITVVLAAILYAYLHVNTPSQNPRISFIAQGYQSQQTWGDPTDCSNTTNAAQCNSIPAIFLTITSFSPPVIRLTDLQFWLYCNGTSLLNGTFAALELIPGTGQNPPAGSPTLGKCGSWSPSPFGNHATWFNRLAYFQQLFPGKTALSVGDLFVIYAHPPTGFKDWGCTHGKYRSGSPECSGNDDDFHGAPLWCYSVPGLCQVVIYDTAGANGIVGTINLYGLAPA